MYTQNQKVIYFNLLQQYHLIIDNPDNYTKKQVGIVMNNLQRCITETIPKEQVREKNLFVQCIARLRTVHFDGGCYCPEIDMDGSAFTGSCSICSQLPSSAFPDDKGGG